MKNIKIEKIDDPKLAYIFTVGEHTTPVWLQAEWDEGPDVFFIRRNGCGHCCTAMALRLCGVSDMDPAKEYATCLKLWGEPLEENGQDHFQTAKGMVRILSEYGVKAEAKGVKDAHVAMEDILNALRGGNFVIFWSSPKEGIYNPFSPFDHYVLAAGLADDGEKIVVLNNGVDATCEEDLLYDIKTVEQALYVGSAPELSEWGYDERLPMCGGYVIVYP